MENVHTVQKGTRNADILLRKNLPLFAEKTVPAKRLQEFKSTFTVTSELQW